MGIFPVFRDIMRPTLGHRVRLASRQKDRDIRIQVNRDNLHQVVPTAGSGDKCASNRICTPHYNWL
ncbi:hypothetical protein KILIM_032_00210 [Kineosphaera limosa NBRC 100340]|uniref:Uncharacterized protein n=1 Tax=Kineosphaera limosa NBRC 100340 TaxID=1184609 RepID=K6WQM0_9MICO|nr:hypothetical protein KILIM_032_00210 [Kineosphaera limosa NBRC 100340]